MTEMDFLQEERKVTVWKPIPQDYRKLVISLAAAGVVILVAVCILWGWIWTLVAGLVLAIAALVTHYMLQRRIQVDKGYFYLDRDELYFISLAKEDEKLRAYLEEASESPKTADPSMLPNAFLMSMAEYSVISHISCINSFIKEKKKDTYTLHFNYELIAYPCGSAMRFSIRNVYENFDSLVQLLTNRAVNIVSQ